MWGSTFVNVLLLATSISAQRFDGQFWPCNPLKNATGACPPNRGLPTSTYSVDFTKQTSVPDDWTVSNYATVNFGSQGAEFTFNKRWDAPQLWTDFFILFGRVSIVARVANGTGMISSAVLISDVFDEIDFEMSGNNFGHSEWSAGKGQNNYFGKGITGTYDRGSYFDVSNPQGTFHTYTFDWSPTELKWLVDGRVVRSHLATDGDTNTHQFPQTPSKFQLGIWAGGDPSSNQGTREWAGGYTDLEGGPYTMWVKSVVIENAMPAWAYNYTDQSGDWRSIALLKEPFSGNAGAETTSKSVSSATKSISSTLKSISSTSRPVSSASKPMVSASKPAATSATSVSKSAASSSKSTSRSSAGVLPPNSTTKPTTTTTFSRPMTVPHATSLTSSKQPTSTVKTLSTSKALASSISKSPTSSLPTTSTTKASKTVSSAGSIKPTSTQSKSSSKPTSAKRPPGYATTSTSRSPTAAISKKPTATAISIISKASVAKRPTATTISGIKYVYSYTTTTKCSTTATPKPKQYEARAATTSATDWEWSGWNNQWHGDRERPAGERHAHAHAHAH